MVFNLVAEVQDLWPRLQRNIGPHVYQTASQWLEDTQIERVAAWVLDVDPDLGPAALEAELQRQASSLQDFLMDQLRNTTKSVPLIFLKLGITIVVFFFFLRQGPEWVRSAKRALPLVPEHSERLFAIAERTINAAFRGVILTAAVQALLAGVGYWVAGAGVPVLLACVTFLAALIPFVGPVSVWLPTSIGLIIAGRPGRHRPRGLGHSRREPRRQHPQTVPHRTGDETAPALALPGDPGRSEAVRIPGHRGRPRRLGAGHGVLPDLHRGEEAPRRLTAPGCFVLRCPARCPCRGGGEVIVEPR